MNTWLRNLRIAFELASPEDVYSGLIHRDSFLSRNLNTYIDSFGMSEGCYNMLSRKLDKAYSIDEIRLMYEDMKNMCCARSDIPHSLFQLLVGFGMEIFRYENGMPVCKRNKIMSLRAISLLLGQDILTMAYLAYLTFSGKISRQTVFDWDTKVETDDNRLKGILRKGIAENHFHLEGSTPLFSLSWVAVMNHPQIISKFFSDLYGGKSPFDVRRSATISFSDQYHSMGWEQRLRCAVWIRYRMFCIVNGITYDNTKTISQLDFEFADTPELNTVITDLRLEYGCRFDQQGKYKKCLDYAIRSDNIFFDQNSKNRLLCGERELLYQCFLNCFYGKFTHEQQDLFYLYLLIKTGFRSELVQVNREIGFANFSIYQSRKSTFWKMLPEYLIESRRLTINAAFETGTIKSLELRIQPKKTPEDNITQIEKEDRCVLSADSNHRFSADEQTVSRYTKKEQVKMGLDFPFFFVLHFIKRQMKKPLKSDAFSAQTPRNSEVRETARRCSLSLAEALEKSDYLCSRIRGIDAASFEIGCRPEVFATEFRFLKSFVPRERPIDLCSDIKRLRPKLGITYHVGEDFLDISDGLRAIDEAIRFLHMSRGDRLGHALALGVDPKIHYRTKHKLVIMPKQDMLDNLVWILKKSVEYGITVESNLREKMRSCAKRLLTEIYGDCIQEQGITVTLDDYYHSWELRGDNPEYYAERRYNPVYKQEGRLCTQDSILEKYRDCFEDDWCDDIYRHKNNISGILHYYHYGFNERNEGLKVFKFEVEEEYIRLMAELQKKMREIISEKGIAIECNLSSNHLIGTFGEYYLHPIFNFNSHKLSPKYNVDDISVSLNTDDQGVFDTSLENEYALLVQCMSEMKDEHDRRLFGDEVIYEYADYIRRLGVEQTFPSPSI